MPTQEQYDKFYKDPSKFMTPQQFKDWNEYHEEFEWRKQEFFPDPWDLQMDNKKLWQEWENFKKIMQRKYGIKSVEEYIEGEKVKPIEEKEPTPPEPLIVKKNRDLEMKLLGYA